MRLRLPGSLSGRLVAVASLLIAAAILVACLAMGFALHRFVTGQIDQRLDAQALAIASALRPLPNGDVALAATFDAPPFDRPRSGWFWQVRDGDDALLASISLGPRGGDLTVTPPDPAREPRPAPRRPHRAEGGPEPVEASLAGGGGPALHARAMAALFEGRTLTILVTAPERAIDGPLREALLPIVVAMLVLAAALVVAIRVQVRVGLLPLDRLRLSLAAVRSGTARHIPEDQPREIAPLASELNGLIDENAKGLERARRHVANLAHGLKTPLADLALALQAPGRDPDGEATALIDDMDRRVRHHLARARAAAIGGASRAATPLRPHVLDLVAVLGRIHAARDLDVGVAVPDAATVACEPQDLDEMIGNLLDNACKWAKSRITIGTASEGAFLVLTIEDDGAGLEEDALPEALRPGRRLDEMTPGHGFGLPITRELAELYGGGIAIGRSPLGGLAARLSLPVPLG